METQVDLSPLTGKAMWALKLVTSFMYILLGGTNAGMRFFRLIVSKGQNSKQRTTFVPSVLSFMVFL